MEIDDIIKAQEALAKCKTSADQYLKLIEELPLDALAFLVKTWVDSISSSQYKKEIQLGLGLASAFGYEVLQKRIQS